MPTAALPGSPGSPDLPDFTAPAPPPWSTEQDHRLRCVHIRQETHDVKTFVLAPRAPRSFRYLPGQFITLELDIAGRRINRCYTLSSTPTRPDLVSITVKRVPGGPVSNWLHEQLRVGMALDVLGPGGAFSCFAAPAQRYLFLSGGSGITPLMSMARALHDLGSDADILFVHCARSPADVLFSDELGLMARHMPHLRLATVCEQQAPGSAYAGHLGRLDAALLARIAPDLQQRDIYTCGPAPFMAAIHAYLSGAGFPMARYRQESFAFESLAQPVATALPAAGASTAPANASPRTGAPAYQVRLQKTGHQFDCPAEQTLLQAAIAAGLRLPFSCTSGACGTCKSKKIAGQVRIEHAGGIRQREIDQGWILPCCSKPLSDIVLDR
ncbi:FAD-binding oxidoreductase [Verminephrobacter eiseniae]|uniref:hybrid-cluster NAD(P)-dependent oxidoreductase n=1 Tax=Verminephrobacter eiseniae TaxID=364317 RepID=UPI0022376346|nr:hybrid-cluster NAD(P)-dependent oxidoreductase [Verminephrobacter eiseniae]MCW5231842.1 hybrid-cluster NAD(P)-dependent oxidoreductase [Verminephrobacter eiseniae]MCW5293576.1 hybrid-cluster NAD(P)-dependent oxidoreductase [Verminephrobacter eiseniae]MCW8186130.1 hybrid-cluster NAD(P)-dependent oxidoreductase [Verminephrobacter eiseniae]MCW8224629.1 hybrid-cluster NAD(P)-dependent oxidoreductase [Verminephrobacter eiseniae]MCW8233247.1 hybrid-cluster NAD(P)-dependent oxidoreductase [Vermine